MKMNKEERWDRLVGIIEDQGLDVDDLVAFMELTVEDMLVHCKGLLLSNEHKFVLEYGEDDEGQEE
jgi:hypothetical protein